MSHSRSDARRNRKLKASCTRLPYDLQFSFSILDVLKHRGPGRLWIRDAPGAVDNPEPDGGMIGG